MSRYPIPNQYADFVSSPVPSFREMASKVRSLVLCGNPGTMKTGTACAVAKSWRKLLGDKALLFADTAIAFLTEGQMAAALQASLMARPGELNRDEFVQQMVEAPILILDDVGTALAGEREVAAIGDILRRRADAGGRGTILTTNLAASALDPRLQSRCAIFILTGADRRKVERLHTGNAVVDAAPDWLVPYQRHVRAWLALGSQERFSIVHEWWRRRDAYTPSESGVVALVGHGGEGMPLVWQKLVFEPEKLGKDLWNYANRIAFALIRTNHPVGDA